MTLSIIHHRKPTKPIFNFLSKKSSTLLLITMSTLFFLSLLSLILFFSLSSASRHHHHSSPTAKPTPTSTPSSLIQQVCKATRFPDQCVSSLSQSKQLPADPTPLQLLYSSISVSSDNLRTAQSMVKSILASSSGSVNRTTAATNCLEVLDNAQYRISITTNDALPQGNLKNARAWMSSSLLSQYDCWSALKYANDTSLTNETMSFLDSLTHLTSNALSLLFSYDNFGNDTASWVPARTERDGFWEPVGKSGGGFKGGVPTDLKADVTVSKDGSGSYKTVQEAVNAAPENGGGKRFVIRIKAGVYEETVRIPLAKKNVVFLGDGIGKTVITGSLNVGQPGISTYNTATVAVLGDGFMASGLTIQNTAGPDAHQAVAFRSGSDLSVIENCEFLGNQDTLYAQSLRQFYKSCRIQGNVDFIFGNSASFFQDCEILVAPRQIKPEKGETNAITAHGRTDPGQSTGFVFQNCLINGTEEYLKLYNSNPKVHKNFLGRPWKEYSRTVFIQCNLEALVSPLGWLPWSGDFALKTLYYGESGNSGSGSTASKRVTWSSQIPAQHIDTYSVENFIQGNQWIPLSK
ncbi:probable pectinesterase/pectinesterase inhibitor 51 [Quercus robur]|uniref:probable pectinesterase/pectinesterase inhibitor 51 n=1 Tax=Quercus robur TaxID=38942 RepID=UPI0021614331|nr:probable pectinesterase/pectinesterase inhibitor 51 [Quercus robur]